MESAGCKDGPGNNVGVGSKLRSPSKVNDSHTMDSFQDGGQQNMSSEQNDFPPPLDGPHMNSEMNNYPPGPGDQGMPPEGFGRINEGMNPGQMQGFGYNRGNYNMGDQHGGLNMAGSPDYAAQGPQYHGQYPQTGMRSGYPTGPKPGMGHVRPGMGSPGMGMMPPGYNSGNPRMMSGQSIAQQGGPTPTLNQLLQTPNTSQRFQNSYNDYGGGPQKTGGDMGGGDPPYGVQQGWGSQRPMNPYSQGPMSGNVPYRNPSGPMPPEMNQQRRQPGMPPSYPSQSGQYPGGQQFSPNSQPQRYGMMSTPGRMMPGQMGQMNQSYNQQMTSQYGHHHQGAMGYNNQSMTPQQPAPPLQQQSPQPGPPVSQSGGPYLSPPQAGSHPPTSTGNSGSSGSPSSQSSPQPAQHRVTPPLVKPHALKPHHASFILQQQQQQQSVSQSHPHQPQHQQQQAPQAASESSPEGFSNSRPSKQTNQDNDMEVNSNFDENSDGGRLSTPPTSSSGPQHPVVSSLRPVTSPAGSTGSRSNTPASLTGTQTGSPMPPRPPSRQLDGQSRMSSNQSPMPTSYNQQMMPPPLGPNQMGYGAGNKMGSGPQMGSQMGQMGHFPQYNSQFHQGNYPRQAGPGPGPGPGPGSGMQGYGGPHQNSFNGPSQMPPASSMYGNMNRNMPNMPNMPNSGYSNSFNQGNNMHMGMGNQYGNFNTSNSHSTPGTNSAMGMNSMGPPMNSGIPNMSSPGGPPTSAKGAQAAAQAAMLAAANSAVNRPQPSVRPSTTPMTNHQRMYTPQTMNQMGSMGHMNSMTGGYPGMNQMSNSQPMSQMPNSMSQSPVPSSMNQMPNSMSEAGGMSSSSGMPMMPHSTMSSSVNMPNSNMPNMSMPNTSTPHSGMPGVSNMPSHSSHMPNVGMPHHSGFPTNSSNPLSNMANMSAGIMSSNPPGSGIPNTSMSNSSVASSVNSVSSDSGVSSMGSGKMCSSSSSGSGPTPPLSADSKPQNSANPASSMGQSGPIEHTAGSAHTSAPTTPASAPVPASQGLQVSGPPTSVPSTSAPLNCTAQSGEEVKPSTTTATTNSVTTSTVVTQSITSPVTSIAENSNSSSTDAHSENMVNLPVVCTPAVVEDTPDKKKKESVSLPQTPVGIAPSPGTASVSSFHEEFDNISSPSWPGTPKSSTPDLSKLFEMGDEPNRRPFLEKLFQYLEEKGNPVTAMPSISKQPLDLYKLYLQVREKGGMVEVTKTKKWKEICGVVNIGASASAAFTLKKNYIKYLFSYECKFDKGGIDPAPILAQMEAALQQKRESKNRARAPSPANSQGSQDAFRPASAPNSQGMESFHPGMQQPTGYMGNDVGMGPMGNSMMPPNSMMNNMGGGLPNMPPPGAMGSMQPHPMGAHQPMGGGGNMQGTMMPGNMPQNSMMPHNNYNMPQNNMMGPGSNGMPPPQPGNASNMMPNNADSVSVQDPFADEPNTNPNTQYPRYGGNNQMPYNSGMQPPTSMNNSYNQFGNRGGMGGSNVPVPPYNSSAGHPVASNYNDTMNRTPNQTEPFNESYRRPPGPPGPPGSQLSTDGFSGNQSADPYSSNNSSQFSGNRMNQAGPTSGQYPFGQQQFERYEQQGSMAPPGNQPFRSPSHPQQPMGGVPPSQQHGPDQMYPGRYSSQQASPRPPMSQPNQYNQQAGFPNQGSGFPTPSKTMSGPDQYQRYPTPPPPPHQQPPQPSTPQSAQSSPFPSQRPIYGTPPKRYLERPEYNMPPAYCQQPSMYGEKNTMGSGYGPHRSGMLPPHHDGQMAESRRDMSGWSPMPRYPPQHPGSPYSGPSMGNIPPGHHSNMAMYNRLNRQMSPQREKMGYMSPPKLQKSGMIQNTHFMPKKEIIFPPDSVEAIQPLLAKRKKLTSKDVGPIEAWRLMMALKSGMLAESTWALDTLSVMLYDDNTVGYFGLIHLPGLLEVLIEHFRQCLVQIFGFFEELEIGRAKKAESLSPRKKLKVTSEDDAEADESLEMDMSRDEIDCDSRLVVPDPKELKDSFNWENYTYVTRQGKSVKVEENSKDAAIMADTKLWDTYVGFDSGVRHWKVGCGETTKHIATHFESDDNLSIMKELFYRWISKNSISRVKMERECDENSSASTENCELLEECSKEMNGTSTEDSVKAEVPEVNTKDSTNNKSNCVLDSSDHVKNDFLKVPIKTEPSDPDNNKMEVETGTDKPCVNGERKDKDNKTDEGKKTEDSKEPVSGDSKEDSATKSNEKETSDSTANSSADNSMKSECQDKDNSSSKPYLACFFSSENTKDLLRGFKRPLKEDLEEEAYQRDEPALCLTSAAQEETSRRCICVSNIIRSLSFIPGNDKEMSKHAGLLYILGKLLLLHHTHQVRPKKRPKLDHDDSVAEDLVDLTHGAEGWWWDCLNALRENTLVTLANLSGKLNLSKYPEEICLPILDGLLHWSVCPSACAQDPLPTMPSTSVLSPQRLVLETMCKLSIQEANVDLMLATPPFSRIVQLFSNLCKLLANKKQQVTQEFAIVMLAALVQGDSSAARAIAMQHPCISLLIDFLETAEQNALQVANTHGVQMLRDNPETMGTSLDMLRRAASTLVHMARVPENRTLFVHHQSRLLALVMSQILDQHVAQILAEVLYECSQS